MIEPLKIKNDIIFIQVHPKSTDENVKYITCLRKDHWTTLHNSKKQLSSQLAVRNLILKDPEIKKQEVFIESQDGYYRVYWRKALSGYVEEFHSAKLNIAMAIDVYDWLVGNDFI